MEIVGINYVKLPIPTDREAQARDFYCQILGLVESSPPTRGAQREGLWFELGGLWLHLAPQIDFQTGAAPLAFLVTDLEAVITDLRAAGVSLFGEGATSPKAFCTVHDPFGNTIELMEPG